jgi:HSP20 family molecular chaperone IbpA
MRWAFIVLFLCALGDANVAFAGPKEDKALQEKRKKAAKLYEDADALYKAAEYEQSLALFKEAYLLTSEPVLLFNIAQCHRQLKQLDEARKSYESFLRDAPAESELRANAEARLSEVNAEIARLASKSSLQISSKQDPAEAFLNGESKGQTPITISDLEPGKYVITIRKAGYEDAQVSVTLEPNQSLPLEIPDLVAIKVDKTLPKNVVITSVATAALFLGSSVVGSLALSTARNSVESQTPDVDMQTALRIAHFSTGGFVATAVGVGATYYLFKKSRTPETNAHISVSPTNIALQFSF